MTNLGRMIKIQIKKGAVKIRTMMRKKKMKSGSGVTDGN
jgi:hypothetical protein